MGAMRDWGRGGLTTWVNSRYCHSQTWGINVDGSMNANELQVPMTCLLSALVSDWVENGFLCPEARKAPVRKYC